MAYVPWPMIFKLFRLYLISFSQQHQNFATLFTLASTRFHALMFAAVESYQLTDLAMGEFSWDDVEAFLWRQCGWRFFS